MREIIFDTETTGLNAAVDKIIEIGAVELINRNITTNKLHFYLNPGNVRVSQGAFKVHGLSNEFLEDKPYFSDIVNDFLKFIEDAQLVAHNAFFDIGFLNAEFARVNYPILPKTRVVDTLPLARQKFPGMSNTLDALCKRLKINSTHRKLHGALLDSELLAEVYIELLGGKQQAMGFLEKADSVSNQFESIRANKSINVTRIREKELSKFLTNDEQELHENMIKILGENALWLKKMVVAE